LLSEVRALNHAGGLVARIERLERLADILSRTNIGSDRVNFINFLKYQIVREPSPKYLTATRQ
jgi:hypothetical protein